MARQTSFLEEQVKPTIEKTRLEAREVARAFINNAISLDLSPERVYASLRARGKAVSQARELIGRYFYSGANDPRGISLPGSNPGSVAGTYRNLYNKALETLAISDPILYQPRTEEFELPDGAAASRYKAFYEKAKDVAPSTNKIVVQTMRSLLSRYHPAVHQAEDPKKLMGQFIHLRKASKERGKNSNSKIG